MRWGEIQASSLVEEVHHSSPIGAVRSDIHSCRLQPHYAGSLAQDIQLPVSVAVFRLLLSLHVLLHRIVSKADQERRKIAAVKAAQRATQTCKLPFALFFR